MRTAEAKSHVWDAAQYAEHLKHDIRLQVVTPSVVREARAYTDGSALSCLARLSVRLPHLMSPGLLPGDLAERLDDRDAAIGRLKARAGKLLEDSQQRIGREARWRQDAITQGNQSPLYDHLAAGFSRNVYAMTRQGNHIACVPHERRVVVSDNINRFGIKLWRNGDGGVTFTDYPEDDTTLELRITHADQPVSFAALPPLSATALAVHLTAVLDTRLTDQEISGQCRMPSVPPPTV